MSSIPPSHPATPAVAPAHGDLATAPLRLGVGVLIVRDGRVLLGERLGSHGARTWAAPGGHPDPGETPEACARRETAEETGLVIGALERAPWTVDDFPETGRRYVTLFVVAHDAVGEPVPREPAACAGWSWHRWAALPRPLFAPLASLVATGWTPAGCGARGEGSTGSA